VKTAATHPLRGAPHHANTLLGTVVPASMHCLRHQPATHALQTPDQKPRSPLTRQQEPEQRIRPHEAVTMPMQARNLLSDLDLAGNHGHGGQASTAPRAYAPLRPPQLRCSPLHLASMPQTDLGAAAPARADRRVQIKKILETSG
jgi:hypothetical protein